MRTPFRTMLIAVALASSPAAFAAEKQAEDAPELAKYTRTGETESCLSTLRIDTVQILNKRQILFKMKGGGEAYLNEPDNCLGLTKSAALVYEATLNEICGTTIVKIAEPMGGMSGIRGACGLGKFQKLEKKPEQPTP